MPNLSDRFQGCLLGLAIGDAIGTTVEFSPRGTFRPLTDMDGGGPFGLKPGEWTDDTSMALCLAASLVECDGFDARDQMIRYCRWRDEGYMSSNGRCFDIGNTVSDALMRFTITDEPFSGSTLPHSAGNGSLMRLAPVVMYFYPNSEAISHYARESSRTTHGTLECLDGCQLLAEYLHRAIQGFDKPEVLAEVADNFKAARINTIAKGGWRDKSPEEIRGSGYVVECLEAAIWCFDTTDSFDKAILKAANLGDDADTTAAVCGQIAGAYYGASAIPERWGNRIAKRSEIISYAEALRKAS